MGHDILCRRNVLQVWTMTTNEDANAQSDPDIREQLTNDNHGKTPRPIIKIDPNNVPPELHPLIPYAEKWGIPDRKLQEMLLHEAPLAEIEELYQIMYPLWDDIDRFTILRSSPDEYASYEVAIFEVFRGAFNEASSIVLEKMPERWLEIIGWPEAWPSFALDPAKIPFELQPMIPFAQKWVIEDQGVRDTVFKLATNEELEELIAAVKQIGVERICDLAIKMPYEEGPEGYALLLLMDMVREAEFDLRHRRNVTPPDENVPE